jgi:hypothetical protein
VKPTPSPRRRRSVLFALFNATLAAASPAAEPAVPHPSSTPSPVACHRVAMDQYQCFIKNWDEKQNPVLCAVVRTPADFSALFHPAPVAGTPRPFAPPPEFFTKEQILVVARVLPAQTSPDGGFTFEKLTRQNNELALHYRFQPQSSKATFSVKNFLALRLPQHPYSSVTFYENGRKIKTLKTDQNN